MKVQFDKVIFLQRLQADHFEATFPQFQDPKTNEAAVLKIPFDLVGDDQTLYQQLVADHIRELLESTLRDRHPVHHIGGAEMERYRLEEINNKLSIGELEIGIQVQMKLALLEAARYYADGEVVKVAEKQFSIPYLLQPNSTIDVDLWSQLMIAMGVVPKLSLDFRAAQKAEDDDSMNAGTGAAANDTPPEEPSSDDQLLASLMDSLPDTPVASKEGTGKSPAELDNLCKKFERSTIYPIGSIDLRKGELQFLMMGLMRMDLPFNPDTLWRENLTSGREILVKHIWGTMVDSVHKEYSDVIDPQMDIQQLQHQHEQGMRVENISDDFRALEILHDVLVFATGQGGVTDLRLHGVVFYSGGETKENLNLVRMRLCFARNTGGHEHSTTTVASIDTSKTWIELSDQETMAEINRLANMAMNDR